MIIPVGNKGGAARGTITISRQGARNKVRKSHARVLFVPLGKREDKVVTLFTNLMLALDRK